MKKKDSVPSSDAFKAHEIQPEDASPAEACEDPRLGVLEEQIAVLHDRIASMEQEHLLFIADMKNDAQRAAKHAKQQELFAAQKLITGLLPALDALDAALQLPQEQLTIETLLQGCHMTQGQLLSVLAAHGLEKMVPERGTAFDPEAHEAIQMLSEEGVNPGAVLAVYQPGYRLSGRVIRTAKVSVNA